MERFDMQYMVERNQWAVGLRKTINGKLYSAVEFIEDADGRPCPSGLEDAKVALQVRLEKIGCLGNE